MRVIGIIFVLCIYITFNAIKAKPGEPVALNPLRSITVFYWDSVSIKGKYVYRELTHIGDEPVWSKPESLDIQVEFDTTVKVKGVVQIAIEELQRINEDQQLMTGSLGYPTDTTWVVNKVIFMSGYPQKGKKIEIKNVPYQTAFFMDHMFVAKHGFRVVVFFRLNNSDIVQTLKKEFYFD